MKSSILLFILLFTALSFNENYAQPASSGWSLGFGGVYPRFISVSGDGYSGNTNFGGYFSLERNFSEYISLRLRLGAYHLESYYYKTRLADRQKVDFLTTDLDLIYLLSPVNPFHPTFFSAADLSAHIRSILSTKSWIMGW